MDETDVAPPERSRPVGPRPGPSSTLPPLPDDVRAAVSAVVALARAAPGTVGVALVGSWARGAGRDDSDVDLLVLTERPGRWLDDSSWHGEVGPGATLVAERDFGAVQERRLGLRSGLEVELCVGRPSWADAARLDAGTRRVVQDGMQVLWDPHGLLSRLARTGTRGRTA